MSGELYLTLLWVIYAVGLVGAGAYLVLYRPTRWRTSAARDASGWVAVIWIMYAWFAWRTATATATPLDGQLGVRLVSLAIGVLLDVLVVTRLVRFIKIRREERDRPTQVCPTCGGSGVVLTHRPGCPIS